MRIAGRWQKCTDDVTRPVIVIRVRDVDGSPFDEMFLIDCGADRTVFSAALLSQLGGAKESAPPGQALGGVGGTQPFVRVQASLELARADGGTVVVSANFAAFTDPIATDLSILGRDVLDHFDVVLSRRRDEILLLAGSHNYQIHSA